MVHVLHYSYVWKQGINFINKNGINRGFSLTIIMVHVRKTKVITKNVSQMEWCYSAYGMLFTKRNITNRLVSGATTARASCNIILTSALLVQKSSSGDIMFLPFECRASRPLPSLYRTAILLAHISFCFVFGGSSKKAIIEGCMLIIYNCVIAYQKYESSIQKSVHAASQM